MDDDKSLVIVVGVIIPLIAAVIGLTPFFYNLITGTPQSTPTHEATNITQPTVSSTLTDIAVTYPCDAQISGVGSSLNRVYTNPSTGQPNRPPVQRGSDVRVLDAERDFGINWYQIQYGDNNSGWIDGQYLELSSNCPNNE
ncbi:MAG: hypothetical protein AAF846_13920 [Chloroflexota bacterium]